MDNPDYFIINPLQLEQLVTFNSKNSKKDNFNIIDKRFYEKMQKLKNISLETRRLKYMISHRISLYDI